MIRYKEGERVRLKVKPTYAHGKCDWIRNYEKSGKICTIRDVKYDPNGAPYFLRLDFGNEEIWSVGFDDVELVKKRKELKSWVLE